MQLVVYAPFSYSPMTIAYNIRLANNIMHPHFTLERLHPTRHRLHSHTRTDSARILAPTARTPLPLLGLKISCPTFSDSTRFSHVCPSTFDRRARNRPLSILPHGDEYYACSNSTNKIYPSPLLEMSGVPCSVPPALQRFTWRITPKLTV